MSKRIGNYVRHQHLALLALFLVLTGGTAYALTGSNTVFSDDIVNGHVRTADVANDNTAAALRGVDIANGSLTGTDVANDSVGGQQINESTLGTVPSAAQGGTGRYGFTGSCDPESAGIYLDCSSVSVPLSAPGRVLIIGQVMASPDDGGSWGMGVCRLEVDGAPIEASATKFWWDKGDPGSGFENATLTAVSSVLPAGGRFVGIECHESHTGDGSGSLFVELARISAVTLSAG